MPKNHTSVYKFITEVLTTKWQVANCTPEKMLQDVSAHNKRFDHPIHCVRVQIREHAKGCEVRKVGRGDKFGIIPK